MIQVQIDEVPTAITYPRLMVNEYGTVKLFLNRLDGVLFTTDGEVAVHWGQSPESRKLNIPADHTSWRPFHGVITIKGVEP